MTVRITGLFAAGVIAAMQFTSPGAHAAAPNNYVCAISEVQECRMNGSCRRIPPQTINLAPIMTLDIKKKELASLSLLEKERTEAIEGLKATDDHVFMHGLQDEETWSAVISRKNGSFTGSISTLEAGFAFFGHCAPN